MTLLVCRSLAGGSEWVGALGTRDAFQVKTPSKDLGPLLFLLFKWIKGLAPIRCQTGLGIILPVFPNVAEFFTGGAGWFWRGGEQQQLAQNSTLEKFQRLGRLRQGGRGNGNRPSRFFGVFFGGLMGCLGGLGCPLFQLAQILEDLFLLIRNNVLLLNSLNNFLNNLTY